MARSITQKLQPIGPPLINIAELNSENYKTRESGTDDVDTESEAQVAAESIAADQISTLDIVPDFDGNHLDGV